MALVKYNALNTPDILKKAEFDTFEHARLAHLNDLVDKINASSASATLEAVEPIVGTELTGTTVAPLRAELEIRLVAIENKINEIITALS